MTRALPLQCSEKRMPLKVETYFLSDVDFEVPVHFAVLFSWGLGNHTEAKEKELIARFPMMARKMIKISNQVFGIVIRTWNKKTSELKMTFTSKFGPFDLLYKAVPSYERKYQDGMNKLNPLDLQVAVNRLIRAQRREDITGFFSSYQPQGMAYITSEKNAELIKVAKTAARPIIYETPVRGLYNYIRCKYTLTRWFWGKKAALEKISQDRVRKYLNKDKKDLEEVTRFFGTNLKV